MPKKSPFLVSPNWLHSNLDDPELAIVDASWHLPTSKRDGREEYEQQHIPGAVFFDIDAISDLASDLPHTLASPEHFAEQVGKLGISEDQKIVVYDSIGLFSAPRVWWNFRIMGAKNVFILDGGLPAWIKERLPVNPGNPALPQKTFTPNFEPEAVVSFEEMLDAVKNNSSTIADARPTARFTGEEAEPREGMKSGHMPGAKSLPASSLQKDGMLLLVPELRQVLEKANITADDQVISTCGSGVTAATIALALASIGHTNHRLYDGSWSQWGSRDDTPIETG